MNTENGTTSSGIKPPVVVWGGLMMGMITYFVVLVIITADGAGTDADNLELVNALSPILFGVSVILIPVIFFLRKLLFFKRFEEGGFGSVTELKGAYFTASIVSWALAEAIAIFGFLLSFLSYELIYYLAGFGLSAALFLALFPREDKLIEEYKRKNPGFDLTA